MQRDDKPALVALALMLAAILALAAIEVGFRNAPTDPPAQSSSAGVDQQQDDYRPPRGSEDGHFFGDSWAQWLMAIFTVAATGISAMAVKLVNDTLKTSREATLAAFEAVSVTRDIGERQVRPYILYEGTKVGVLKLEATHPKRLELEVTLRNCGASPGIITARSGAIYGPANHGIWESKGGSWQSLRMVIGPNQTDRLRFDGISADPSGNFTWFSIGVLLWYESLSGSAYEEHFWLTFDGSEMRQDFHDAGHALYRPQNDDSHED